MCEKRTRKVKKGSHLTRLREARRLQRLQWLATPVSTSDDSNSSNSSAAAVPHPSPPQVDKVAQNRVILELAWKTVALMQKNRIIQQKIIALQKETSEFVSSVMNNPENRERIELYRRHGLTQAQIRAHIHAQCTQRMPCSIPIKVEPNV